MCLPKANTLRLWSLSEENKLCFSGSKLSEMAKENLSILYAKAIHCPLVMSHKNCNLDFNTLHYL